MNSLLNQDVKCEILHNVDIEQILENMNERNKKLNIREQLMNLTKSKQKLFVRVEQGSSKNSNNVFVLFYPSMRKAERVIGVTQNQNWTSSSQL